MKRQEAMSGLAAAQIRAARMLLDEFVRSPSTSYKLAVMTLGNVKFCLDRAGEFCDSFNHYTGEQS